MNKNCIVVYAQCGEGHKMAAQAIATHLGVACYDILDFALPGVRLVYSGGYRFAIKYLPFVWFLLYELSRLKIIRNIIDAIHKVLFFPFVKFIKQRDIHSVIATHFFPIALLSPKKYLLDLELFTVVTDLGVHPLWVHRDVDAYYVAIDDTKEDLINYGIKEESIHVVGMPLRDGFRKVCDRKALKEKFKLDARPSILVFSSTHGNIPYMRYLVKALHGHFNIFIIYGSNKIAKGFLEKERYPSVFYYSFYENIWELMELASVIVTKPGGMTIFEAMYKRKHLIFTHYIWGQEKSNMDIIIKRGLGHFASNAKDLKEIIYQIRDKNHHIDRDQLGLNQDIFLSIEDKLSVPY